MCGRQVLRVASSAGAVRARCGRGWASRVPRTWSSAVLRARVPRTWSSAVLRARVPRTWSSAVLRARVPRTWSFGRAAGAGSADVVIRPCCWRWFRGRGHRLCCARGFRGRGSPPNQRTNDRQGGPRNGSPSEQADGFEAVRWLGGSRWMQIAVGGGDSGVGHPFVRPLVRTGTVDHGARVGRSLPDRFPAGWNAGRYTGRTTGRSPARVERGAIQRADDGSLGGRVERRAIHWANDGLPGGPVERWAIQRADDGLLPRRVERGAIQRANDGLLPRRVERGAIQGPDRPAERVLTGWPTLPASGPGSAAAPSGRTGRSLAGRDPLGADRRGRTRPPRTAGTA